jgi:hypothetical protein
MTNEIARLLASESTAKVAVAYWGQDALRLLKLKPDRSDLRVLCCLRGGKSDPGIIRRFGNRARQIDNLHAKVFWTPKGAIIGSANASANGLPEEDDIANNLIEAGVFLNDENELAKIERWFNQLYESGREITKSDLENAARERAARTGGRVPKRSFVESLINNPSEFSQQRIYFYFYNDFCSQEENDSVKKEKREHSKEINADYGLSDLAGCDWYTFSRGKPPEDFFPPNCVLIEGRYRNGKLNPKKLYVRKTLDFLKPRPIKVEGKREWVLFVLEEPFVSSFNYKLTGRDTDIIAQAAPALWEKARKGIENDRIIALRDARSTLLKFWTSAR